MTEKWSNLLMGDGLFSNAVNVEKIDLGKIGWTKDCSDKLIFSYIRGYIWRNYRIRIKKPLDFIIHCMICDVLRNNK